MSSKSNKENRSDKLKQRRNQGRNESGNKLTSSSADFSENDKFNNDVLSSLIEQYARLKFPRCCICRTDWFLPRDESSSRDRRAKKRSTSWRKDRCRELLPLPSCKCSTKLACHEESALPTIKRLFESFSSDLGDQDFRVLADELKITTFDNLAMCRCCLEKMIDVSGEVLEHDYRDANQPNIRFTVEPKCVQCQVKFNKRKLNALVCYDGSKRRRSATPMTNTGSSVDRLQWLHGLFNTITIVEIGKNIQKKINEKKIDESTYFQNDKVHSHNNETEKRKDISGDEAKDHSKNKETAVETKSSKNTGERKNIVSEILDRMSYLGDGATSDECFSDDEDTISIGYTAKNSIKSRLQQQKLNLLKEGELMEELCRKDPKFRQELDDKRLIEQKMKTLEGRRELGLSNNESQSDEERQKDQSRNKMILMLEDEKLAKELQKEFNKSLQRQLRPSRCRKGIFSLKNSKSTSNIYVKKEPVATDLTDKINTSTQLKTTDRQINKLKLPEEEPSSYNFQGKNYHLNSKLEHYNSKKQSKINAMMEDNNENHLTQHPRFLLRSHSNNVADHDSNTKLDEELARKLQKKFDQEVFAADRKNNNNRKRQPFNVSINHKNNGSNDLDSIKKNNDNGNTEEIWEESVDSQSSSSSCSNYKKELSLQDKRDNSWLEQYNKLLEFKKKYGHCIVPKVFHENPSLGTWVGTQRRRYSQFLHSKSFFSQERIDKLNEIGFVWRAKKPSNNKLGPWEDLFEQLKEHKKKYDDVNNVENYPEFETLATWCYLQRKRYKQSLKGYRNYRKDRYDKLISIGFSFEKLGILDYRWNQYFNELVKFKKEYGHTKVPKRYSKSKNLGQWTMRQRKLFRDSKRKEGGEFKLDRFQKLESIGFDWENINLKRSSKLNMEQPQKEKASLKFSRLNDDESYNDYLDSVGSTLSVSSQHNFDDDDKEYESIHKDHKLALEINSKSSKTSVFSDDVKHAINPTWDIYYKQLVEFKNIYGHTCVTKRNKGFNRLEHWVSTERKNYLESKKGGVPYPLDRFHKLEKIGFIWTLSREILMKCQNLESEKKIKASSSFSTDSETESDSESISEPDKKNDDIENKKITSEVKMRLPPIADAKKPKNVEYISFDKEASGIRNKCIYKAVDSAILPNGLISYDSSGKKKFSSENQQITLEKNIDSEYAGSSQKTTQTIHFLCSSSSDDSLSVEKSSHHDLKRFQGSSEGSIPEELTSRFDSTGTHSVVKRKVQSINNSRFTRRRHEEEKSTRTGVSPPALQTMVTMGFKTTIARQALRDAENNLDLAISMVISEKCAQDYRDTAP